MAESGAHLSSVAAAGDGDCPSIFEVLAQDSLLATLKPALRHVLRIATERNPQRFGRLYVNCDELYICLQLVLESYYLKHYNSTFSENFYGLRRVPLVDGQKAAPASDNIPNSQNLSANERLRSLILVIIVPYVKDKLERLYEKLQDEQAEGSQPRAPGLKTWFYRAFLAVYPVVHAVWEGLVFYFQVAYIFSWKNCHSPVLWLARLRLRNVNDEESLDGSPVVPPLSDLLANRSLVQKLAILLSRAATMTSVAMSTSLSVGVFFLQFLDWWYTSDRRVVDIMTLPNPGPPKKYEVDTRRRLNNICPLCNRLRTNDTALSVSGFVFCYPCIHRYVKEKGCCPLTGYPTKLDHLIRIYQSDVAS